MGGAIMSVDSWLALDGVMLQHNSAANGGALYAVSTTSSALSIRIQSSVLRANSAEHYGGGLFVSKATVAIENSVISCNTALSSKFSANGKSNGDDIHCQAGSSITIDYPSTVEGIGTSCNSCNIERSVLLETEIIPGSFCNVSSSCRKPSIDERANGETPDFLGLCGNGVCDSAVESCLSCPADCKQCSFTGVKLESFQCLPAAALNPQTRSTCYFRSTSRPTPAVSDFMPNSPQPVTGLMTAYFRVPETKRYYFKLEASNVGAKLIIDGLPLINAFFSQDSISSAQFLDLRKEFVHTFEVQFFSTAGSKVKNVSVLWKTNENDDEYVAFNETFYSLNQCGDNILDAAETNDPLLFCQNDRNFTKVASNITTACGSGICHEEIPGMCFTDCYSRITRVCSGTIPPPGHIPAGFSLSDDSLGSLVYNQMLWHLPGIEHFAHGFDIVQGQESLVPVFYFGYCDSQTNRIVQDVYRGNVYTLPEEVFAHPHPSCTFSTQTTAFANSQHMASSYAEENSLSISATVGGSLRRYSANGGAAYSQEQSVKIAKEMESRQEGSLATAEAVCITSKVQMVKHTFHPVFLKDLSRVTSVTDMLPLLYKYGTHFYHRASLGGRLRQITSISKSMSNTKKSSEVSQHAAWSFSAAVSVPAFSASGNYAGSKDVTVTEDQQQEFEQESIRSSILTYGGAPGSFGPTTAANVPTDFGSWAETVDLLPIPVKYELEQISQVIPPSWKSVNDLSLRQLWLEAEDVYYKQNGIYGTQLNGHRYSLYWQYSSQVVNSQFLLRIKDDVSDYSTPIIDQTGPSGSHFPLQFLANTLDYAAIIPFEFEGPKLANKNVSFRIYPTININPSSFSKLFILHDWTNSRQYLVQPPLPSPSSTLLWQPVYNHGVFYLHYSVQSVNGPTTPGGSKYSIASYKFTVKLNGRRSVSKKRSIDGYWPDYATTKYIIDTIPQPSSNLYIGDLRSVELTLERTHTCQGTGNECWYLAATLRDFWISQTFCNDQRSTLCTAPDSGYTVVYRPLEYRNFSMVVSGTVAARTLTFPLYPLQELTTVGAMPL
jgi:organic hydroperoxide reductase OsmC/OhrA